MAFAVDSQFDGGREPDRPASMFEPADAERDFGAHGQFDARSKDIRWHFFLSKHRAIAAAALIVAGGLYWAGFAKSTRKTHRGELNRQK